MLQIKTAERCSAYCADLYFHGFLVEAVRVVCRIHCNDIYDIYRQSKLRQFGTETLWAKPREDSRQRSETWIIFILFTQPSTNVSNRHLE